MLDTLHMLCAIHVSDIGISATIFFIVGLPAEIDAKISSSLLYKSYNYMNQKIKWLFYQLMNKQSLKCRKKFFKKNCL